MPDVSIANLPAFVGAGPDPTDLLVMVDVSDTTASPLGTTKRLTMAQVSTFASITVGVLTATVAINVGSTGNPGQINFRDNANVLRWLVGILGGGATRLSFYHIPTSAEAFAINTDGTSQFFGAVAVSGAVTATGPITMGPTGPGLLSDSWVGGLSSGRTFLNASTSLTLAIGNGDRVVVTNTTFAFKNTGGANVISIDSATAIITVTGGVSATGQVSCGSVSATGQVSCGGVSVNNGTAGAAGSLYSSPTWGVILYGLPGTSGDFLLANRLGANVMNVAPASLNVAFAGSISVAGGCTFGLPISGAGAGPLTIRNTPGGAAGSYTDQAFYLYNVSSSNWAGIQAINDGSMALNWGNPTRYSMVLNITGAITIPGPLEFGLAMRWTGVNTATNAVGGAASAPPATPAIYAIVTMNGTVYKFPLYNP